MKRKTMIQHFFSKRLWLSLLVIAMINPGQLFAQRYKWMSVGSLHNWFSEMGCEAEVARSSSSRQQDGLQWPAIYPYQDSQAYKGLWLGAKDFTDERGDFYEYKVVTMGPRSKGLGEFFPQRFEMISKFDPPKVFVDGVLSFEKNVENEVVDPSIAPDRMIINTVNTLLGITMTRNIMQFGHPEHDNYMIYEYIFTNTGNIDDDDEIELPDNTVTDFRAFFLYRYASCFQTRYIVGNGTGWGMNTMIDARGDGPDNPTTYGDPANENFRAQFAWHGYFPSKVINYDNIGGPIWRVFAPYVAAYDTVGRLGAPHFVGMVTLHADKSANDDSDDPAQPSTTGWYGSDLPETGPNSDPYNVAEMQKRYSWMDYGHMTPRHAWEVEPSGDFATQTGPPHIDIGAPRSGLPGGFSIGNGYGPYTLGPGESVRIVMAEAVNGLSTEKSIEYGVAFKRGNINAETKNRHVMTGKDSLFKTFNLATQNFESGFNIDQPPKPPKLFQVNGGGDRISLSWETYDDVNLKGFNIYRMRGEYNNPLVTPELIYEAGKDEREWDDLTPVRGVAYYYYIECVGLNGLNSSRYYTQTYDPTFLKRPQGAPDSKSMDVIRVVPNPYIISATPGRLTFPGTGTRETDKLAFFNLPGQCRIKIFTETGELVTEIEHTDGSGDAYWYATTSSNQVVVSGIYLAHIEVTEDIVDQSTGEKIYSKGQSKILKFVIIR